ncbi:hypothetical protein Poly51_09480 [Rubripirellula tenax]|uniref:PepSY-associated TM helix n=1 Tax=Rubripirellula tenax TaxID=2528015 RepID=A0A5C6FGV7_9BACT|nr:hypothetical protein [Rubripirellula tenax]TWU60668.1 hypothetical protein Poly51_09480 [Rubripirellula tenax]
MTSKAKTETLAESESTKRKRRTRFTMVLRRVHLYAGLFLLPWVFLYGITGAMLNHYGLFTDSNIVSVPSSTLADSALENFPSADAPGDQVMEQLRIASPGNALRGVRLGFRVSSEFGQGACVRRTATARLGAASGA